MKRKSLATIVLLIVVASPAIRLVTDPLVRHVSNLVFNLDLECNDYPIAEWPR